MLQSLARSVSSHFLAFAPSVQMVVDQGELLGDARDFGPWFFMVRRSKMLGT
jgi:hypothetical protein